MQTKIGDIAVCSQGVVGIIFGIRAEKSGNVFIGRCIINDIKNNHLVGDKWQSKNPVVVGNISEFLSDVDFDTLRKVATSA